MTRSTRSSTRAANSQPSPPDASGAVPPLAAGTLAPATPKKNRRRAAKTAGVVASEEVATVPTAAVLLEQSKLTTDGWYKSKRTTKAYANYVKAAIKWLDGWTDESGVDGSSDETDDGADGVGRREAFSGALSSVSEHTPTVLRLYLAFKCEHEGCGFSTAEGLRSAFKQYFEM